MNHCSTKFVRLKDFSVCGHLCGQTRFCAAFSNRGKSRKRRRHKALRCFALPRPGYRHGAPKSSAIPTSLHPDIHFPAMIPRRGVKIKFFLSVVIYVVKAAFVPFSAIGEKSANACAARLCGISPYPVPDTATALPNQARYQLRYTRIWNDLIGMAPLEQRADAHCTRYPCIITHRRQKGKRILIRFSLMGKLSLDIIKNENIIYL